MSDHDYLTDNTGLVVGDTVEIIDHPQYGQLHSTYYGERFGVTEIIEGAREHIKVLPLDPNSDRAGRGPEVMHVNWVRKVDDVTQPISRPKPGKWHPGDMVVSLFTSTPSVHVLNESGTRWSGIVRPDVQRWADEVESEAKANPRMWRVLIKGGRVVGT